MKIENSNQFLNLPKNKKTEVKEDKSINSADSFVSARETEPFPEKPINGIKDYFENLGNSIKHGATLGRIKTDEFIAYGGKCREELTEAELEELKANAIRKVFIGEGEGDNPFSIILTDLPAVAAECMGGIMGACVGAAMGLVGKNAGEIH